MENEPNQVSPNDPNEKRKSFALPLILAFASSFMVLSLLTFFTHKNLSAMIVVSIFAISAICCFTASILLFRRKTPLAIVFGIFFFLLNGAISLLFGCATIVSRLKF